MGKHERTGKKSNSKDYGKEDMIGCILSINLYNTEMMLERGGGGEKEVDEDKAWSKYTSTYGHISARSRSSATRFSGSELKVQ